MGTSTNRDSLLRALRQIGKEPRYRNELIMSLLEIEKKSMNIGFDAREHITGPIVDAMFDEQSTLSKKLEEGLEFEYLYRSKIAREITMAPTNTQDHVWEPQTTKLLKILSQTDADALIGGAYAGDQAIFVAHNLKKYGNGKCHCFEPNTCQLNMLKNNAHKNHLSNIISNSEGLWEKDGESMELLGFDSFAYAKPATEENDKNQFTTTSIDSYVIKNKIEKLALIMLDIEGGELAALRGATNQLRKSAIEAPSIVFEVHRDYVDWSNGIEKTSIYTFLRGYGYQIYAIRDFNSSVPMKNVPIELIPAETLYLEGPPHGFNMLAIKSPALIEKNNFRICNHVSPKLLWHRDKALHLPIELQ